MTNITLGNKKNLSTLEKDNEYPELKRVDKDSLTNLLKNIENHG